MTVNDAAWRNIALVLSYDGTHYSGFQKQPNLNTIQGQLEEAVQRLTGDWTRVHGSGRTDAGVHARKQVVSFKTSSRIPIERWALALNALLPKDIVVYGAREMPDDFHARFSAKRKTYSYDILCGRYPDVFRRNRQFHHPTPLHAEAMRQGLQLLKGTHDFTSFCSVKDNKESKVRTIFDASMDVIENDEQSGLSGQVLRFRLTGNGFLYNMVRIIVGTLIEVGEGKRTSSDMRRILEARDRSQAGPTAMAHALTLWDIDYGEGLNIP